MKKPFRKQIRAIGLLSGGLDSTLAVRVIQQQGIEVVGLSFSTPFFGPRMAKKAAQDLGIELIICDITEAHFKIVKNPAHGYGKTMNPCIDCHALMLKIAGGLMQEKRFDFIFTGEVLNERPMSQNRRSLNIVAKVSGYEEVVVRPLSAKLLDDTRPEQEGLIKKDMFLDIQGRSRKRQIALAKKFGIKEYPNPAGGCLLTDKGFSRRLKELLENNPAPALHDVRLLSIGRHFRLSNTVKLVVGRNKDENELLKKFFSNDDVLITAVDIPGPWCLLTGIYNDEIIETAGKICAAYSDIEDNNKCPIVVRTKHEEKKFTVVVNKKNRIDSRID